MKLIASMIARNELGRYLEPCIEHLLEFVDEIRVVAEAPQREELEYWAGCNQQRVRVLEAPTSTFFEHEGRARQRLLDWTLAGEPTHVLAIDADEFVTDGALVRAKCEKHPVGVWALCMQEVWNADADGLEIRADGGWDEHDATILWAPEGLPKPLRIPDRALACGRTPEALRRSRHGFTCSGILHFGWANRPEREARHARYAVADGGRYHASAHLDSILFSDDRCKLHREPWPAGLERYRTRILAHAGMR